MNNNYCRGCQAWYDCWMMRAKIKLMRGVMCWLLLGSLLLPGTRGMVLCVGDEGHVAVESAHHDHSDHSHHENAPVQADQACPDVGDAANCPGACVDIPLAVDASSPGVRSLKVAPVFASVSGAAITAGTAALAFDGSRVRIGPASEAESRPAPALLEKRTIVLRI